jgi:hypothetical protein
MPKVVIELSEGQLEHLPSTQYGGVMAKILFNKIKEGIVLPDDARYVNADKLLEHAHIEEDDDECVMPKQYYCIEKSAFDNAVVAFDTFNIRG